MVLWILLKTNMNHSIQCDTLNLNTHPFSTDCVHYLTLYMKIFNKFALFKFTTFSSVSYNFTVKLIDQLLTMPNYLIIKYPAKNELLEIYMHNFTSPNVFELTVPHRKILSARYQFHCLIYHHG